ncbi:tRNA1(Val) (adenine(37)-N6)-methyltransferase [Algoriphagus aquimarinus]|uniref:tRNA1(Val) (adenine(37)-N6)-methyltransferase n=1 Tax=Algoriphagus aquimarinus TaxID=237018 RepID=A0A1I1BF38_9BACT|nr:methyltransferase [Algoriphagus aquimarinus]SFB48256.1 tRNA1Val (adenine37-N6)-methyltransferase [Algoriphagus aquimarinus]
MANSWFQFQQFRINQDRCAMKISTDAVMLGALAHAISTREILDIGTGTGVIALMLAQRFPEAKVQAVEIDSEAASQALENFRANTFSDRMQLWEGRFQDFEAQLNYDLIVSNPPYFPDHLKSSDVQRNMALHTDELSFDDLLGKVIQLLKEDGQFWVILPPRQMQDFQTEAVKKGLFLKTKFTLQDKPGKRIQREICAFSKSQNEVETSGIFIKNEDGTPHESYAKVVSGFLLGFGV